MSTGYIDSALELNKNLENTVPTFANEDNAHSNFRLDYIFLSESLVPHLKNYEVVKNSLTNKASDHYPVTVTLQ